MHVVQIEPGRRANRSRRRWTACAQTRQSSLRSRMRACAAPRAERPWLRRAVVLQPTVTAINGRPRRPWMPSRLEFDTRRTVGRCRVIDTGCASSTRPRRGRGRGKLLRVRFCQCESGDTARVPMTATLGSDPSTWRLIRLRIARWRSSRLSHRQQFVHGTRVAGMLAAHDNGGHRRVAGTTGFCGPCARQVRWPDLDIIAACAGPRLATAGVPASPTPGASSTSASARGRLLECIPDGNRRDHRTGVLVSSRRQ